MKHIQCPQRYTGKKASLFLGGGITACPLWQPIMVDLLKDTDLVLLNPRREHFDITQQNIEMEQITWEFKHLQRATAIMFWFPYETLCPITLFELGKWVCTGKELFIGCHPDYQRKNDVKIQVGLVRKRQKIHYSLEDVAEEIRQFYSET